MDMLDGGERVLHEAVVLVASTKPNRNGENNTPQRVAVSRGVMGMNGCCVK